MVRSRLSAAAALTAAAVSLTSPSDAFSSHVAAARQTPQAPYSSSRHNMVASAEPAHAETASSSSSADADASQSPSTPAFLREFDPELSAMIDAEDGRQRNGLELIASENFASAAVRSVLGSCLTNKYSEGQVGRRYYGGNEYIDQI